MKTRALPILLLGILVVAILPVVSKSCNKEGVEKVKEIIAADFDSGDKPNNLDGDFGTWDKDPNDETQSAVMAFSEDDAGNQGGFSLQIQYDVDSPNPAYNGFWMKLGGMDATPYSEIRFFLKGDAEAGFPDKVKVEVKVQDNKQVGIYYAEDLSESWKEYVIPFSALSRIKDWSSVSEFVLVFDDINSKPKQGTIYLDQVSFR